MIRLVLFCLCTSALGADPLEKPRFKVSKLELSVYEALNSERKDNKVEALKMNQKLTEVARAHAKNMAKREKPALELDGKSLPDRVKEAKYKFDTVNQFITVNAEDGKKFVKIMFSDAKCKGEILSDKYTEMGAAAVFNEKGHLYWCVVFGKPSK